MDVVMAIGLGALAGGVVSYTLAVIHQRLRAVRDPNAPRVRFEVVGSVLGAVTGGLVVPFLSLPVALGLAAASPLVVPSIIGPIGNALRRER